MNNKKTFSTTLSVNTNNTYIVNTADFLSEVKEPIFSKEQFVIATLDIKNTINTTIYINKNISEEDLYDVITTKAYDELELDQAIAYHIEYIETFINIDSDKRSFYLFIIEPTLLENIYKDICKKIKYIDIVIPSPLLLKSLYTKNIINDNGTHCFIYFQNNDAFIAIYNECQFVYAKSLNYSFKDMYERLCELYGERIEYKIFIDFIQNQNLKNTDNKYKDYFTKLYHEIFSNINDILTYIKRAYNLEKIEQIYIGSEIATTTQLNEILEYQLKIKTDNFAFEYGFENAKIYIDQLQSLMQLYTKIDEDKRYNCNFTIFHRPPKFTQRQSGQIIILTLASIILAFSYPATYWILTYASSLEYQLLNKKYKNIHNIKSIREVTIQNKTIEKEKALKYLAIEKQKYIDKKNTLIKINQVKVNYPMKARLLAILTKDLNRFDVRLNSLSYDEDLNSKKFYLNLVSKDDNSITSLIKFLTKKHLYKFDFSIEKIFYNNIDKVYVSKLKVVVL